MLIFIVQFAVYPNATSNIIIIVNPPINPNVAKSVLFPDCDSGINSSTTTNIIAPAAKANAYGNIGVARTTNNAPNIANTGSTSAEACP